MLSVPTVCEEMFEPLESDLSTKTNQEDDVSRRRYTVDLGSLETSSAPAQPPLSAV